MKVKIGNNIYNSNNEPILLILNKKDRENINRMHDEANRICFFPGNYSVNEINSFMDDKKPNKNIEKEEIDLKIRKLLSKYTEETWSNVVINFGKHKNEMVKDIVNFVLKEKYR